MKLGTKIILLLTFSTTFGFGIFFCTIFTFSSNINHKITHDLSSQIIESKAAEAGSWLKQRLSELTIISQTDAVLDMDLEAIRPLIQRLNNSVGINYGNNWGTFAVGGMDGLGWVSDSVTIDISGREYFKKAMTSDQPYIISQPVSSRTDQVPIILICYPLLNRNGEKYGFINGAISLNRLTNLVEEIDFYQGTSWIMDTNGRLYTSLPEESAFILQSVLPLLSDSTFTSVRQWTDKKTRTTVFYTPIPLTNGWFLCTAADTRILMKDTYRLLFYFVVIWLASLTVSLAISYYLIKSITLPVSKLSKTMQSIQEGNLAVMADERGTDEISVLSQTFNIMMIQLRKNEKEKRKAEFRLLQSQINPHFLYNTLDTLQWKAFEHGDDEMVSCISSLSAFFRISLNRGKNFIPLEKELEHVSHYLLIQQIRFRDVLSYEFDVQEDLNSYVVLKLILQPLVENAIQHGIKPKLAPGKVTIQTSRQEDRLLIRVLDNGTGIPIERLQLLQNSLSSPQEAIGFGLINVHQRIQLICGQEYGLEIQSRVQKGTEVLIKLPIIMEEHDYASIDSM